MLSNIFVCLFNSNLVVFVVRPLLLKEEHQVSNVLEKRKADVAKDAGVKEAKQAPDTSQQQQNQIKQKCFDSKT